MYQTCINCKFIISYVCFKIKTMANNLKSFVNIKGEFYESLYDNQQAYLKQCHELVITDGEPI